MSQLGMMERTFPIPLQIISLLENDAEIAILDHANHFCIVDASVPTFSVQGTVIIGGGVLSNKKCPPKKVTPNRAHRYVIKKTK